MMGTSVRIARHGRDHCQAAGAVRAASVRRVLTLLKYFMNTVPVLQLTRAVSSWRDDLFPYCAPCGKDPVVVDDAAVDSQEAKW